MAFGVEFANPVINKKLTSLALTNAHFAAASTYTICCEVSQHADLSVDVRAADSAVLALPTAAHREDTALLLKGRHHRQLPLLHRKRKRLHATLDDPLKAC